MSAREYLFFRHAEAENQDPIFTEEMAAPDVLSSRRIHPILGIVRDSAGRADYPLSPRGREQAGRAATIARDFGAELVISSSLRRSKETADIIAHELALGRREDPDLNEVNPGRSSISSMSFSNAKIAVVSLALMSAYLFDRRVSNRRTGESAADLFARIERVFRRLEQLSASRVAIVGHGYWILTAALLITPRMVRLLARARTIQHGAATRIERSADGNLRVLTLGRPLD